MDRLPVGEYKPALDLEDINRHYRKKTGAEDSGYKQRGNSLPDALPIVGLLQGCAAAGQRKTPRKRRKKHDG
jgi:hypothetical protein